MRSPALLRASALAGVAAATAAVSHGGASALAEPAWSLPALLAALPAALALALLAERAGAARREAARVMLGSRPVASHRGLGLPQTVAVMLAVQGCAHVGLLAAGAPAHPGQAGAVALHTALAILGAALVWAADRTLAGAVAELEQAVAEAIAVLLTPAAVLTGWHQGTPAGHPAVPSRHGRAPPLAA